MPREKDLIKNVVIVLIEISNNKLDFKQFQRFKKRLLFSVNSLLILIDEQFSFQLEIIYD